MNPSRTGRDYIPVMRTLPIVLSGLASIHAQTLLKVDFESDPLGKYVQSLVQKEWAGVTWSNGLSEGRAAIVEGDSVTGKAVRVSYPSGSFGPSMGGAQWRAFLSGNHDTVTMRYRVRFGSDFDFVKGGKLPGLCGSKCNTGGNVPNDTDGWSARLMWRDSVGHAVQYVYFPGQPGTYGYDLPWMVAGKECVFGRGQWHEVRTRIVLNTPRRNGQPAQADGRITSWFDGQLALDTAGFKLRGEDTMHVNQFYVSTFHGGSDASWAPSRDLSARFDGFEITAGGPEALTVERSLRPSRPAGAKTRNAAGQFLPEPDRQPRLPVPGY